MATFVVYLISVTRVLILAYYSEHLYVLNYPDLKYPDWLITVRLECFGKMCILLEYLNGVLYTDFGPVTNMKYYSQICT